MLASVVICAYTMDRWAELAESVASVCRQAVLPKEVFLVIDHNEPLLRRAEAEYNGVVTVVSNRYGRGLSGGRRTGAELATGDVIFFLDDDATAEPGWLEHMLAAYADPNVLGTGGFILPNWVHKPGWFPAEFNWVVGCTYKGMPIGPNNTIRNPIGASMSVRAEVFRRLDGFAHQLGRREGDKTVLGVIAESCEDTEFAIRAAREFPGGVWQFCPESRIRHLVPPSRSTWTYFIRRCRMEGRAKAVLATLAGPHDGLGSERRYAMFLVAAVLRYLARGQWRRMGAVCIGFLVTAFMYYRACRAARRGVANHVILGYSKGSGNPS